MNTNSGLVKERATEWYESKDLYLSGDVPVTLFKIWMVVQYNPHSDGASLVPLSQKINFKLYINHIQFIVIWQ